MGRKPHLIALSALLLLTSGTATAQDTPPSQLGPQVTLGTVFTYQGQLRQNNSPVTGNCDMAFRLYDDASGGGQVGSAITGTVPVANGLFSVSLDFGSAAFAGDARWLDIQVRCPTGAGAFSQLAPRQELTGTPYALYALGAPWGGLTGVPAGFADGIDNDSGPGGAFWALTGNPGTTAAHYLGTTDNMTLTLAVNGTAALRLVPNATSPNVIGGSAANAMAVGMVGGTIAGGGASSTPNRVTDRYGTVSGGGNNQAGNNNASTTDAVYVTIGGGLSNTATISYTTIGGGISNTVSGLHATVGGGAGNTASGPALNISSSMGEKTSGNGPSGVEIVVGAATVSGGYFNTASGETAAVGGGYFNTASGDRATVAGGYGNVASGLAGTVSGGWGNSADTFAAVGGGYVNSAGGYGATVAGGNLNSASGARATIGGGQGNVVSGTYGTIAGGGQTTIGFPATGNRVTDDFGTVSGGGNNQAGDADADTTSAAYATVGGGVTNTATLSYATIGGGIQNSASGVAATVGGGASNVVTATNATIGGGYGNVVTATYASVGGGRLNNATGPYATVAGGESNAARGDGAVVGGGFSNTATGNYAIAGGGEGNSASGDRATVPGGFGNTAQGSYSFAAGSYSKANHDGAFVWADASTFTNFASTANNQFLVQAAGGVGLGTNSPGAQLHVVSGGAIGLPQVFITQTNSADYARLRLGTANSSNYWDLAVGDTANSKMNFYHSATGTNIMSLSSAGSPLIMANGAYLTAGGVWTNASDRNAKANLASVDGRDILDRLVALPIQSWNYQAEGTGVRHIGPMAQDFYATFRVGMNDTSITTVDADGVALAAIQGLYTLVQEKDEHITAQQQQIADMESRLAALEQRLAQSQSPIPNLKSPISFGWLFFGGLLLLNLGVLVGRRWPRAGARQ